MKHFWTFPILAVLLAGCAHPQQPVSPPAQVKATWTCATCSATSTYVLSVVYVATGTACPAATGNYVSVGTTAAGVMTLTFTPTPGDDVCAVVQNILSGQTGPASAVSAPLTVPPYPGTPTAPGLNNIATADVKPLLHQDTNQLPVVAEVRLRIITEGM